MSSTPSIPEAETPAVKPERNIDIQPEDIQLGSESETEVTTGKRQLKRPRSAAGTGLAV